ncbi:unnamed protein product [Mytilus edulis]|uniref:Uncharacterized protein n=1 Tax=Mytilus edulis TaxID=6550 RepID=A0A8S3QPQ2_MYTED|nr:unnamed protein product [Mytilus edulis]
MQTNQLHRPVSSYPYHQNSMFNQCNNIDSFAYNFQSSYFSFRTYWQNSSHILSNPYQGNTFSNLHHPQPMRPTSTCSLYNPFKIMHEVENQSDQSLTNMNESTNTSETDASVSPDSDSDIEDPVNLHSNSALSTTTTSNENLQMPPRYQYLVEGSPLAGPTDWDKTTLYSLRKKDRPCALKMVIDCFLTPEQYETRGGTSAFSKTPLAGVMTSVESKYNQQWSEVGEVEDDVNSGSEDDNGHVDIDLDKSEKNKPSYAKPKPGQLKAGKLTAAQILNNRVQAKRMANSIIMNKLKKKKTNS